MSAANFSRSYGTLAALQSLYFLFTGLWPLVHIESFLTVTGPKDDVWLVETVGVLVTVIGACLGFAAVQRRIAGEVLLLAIGSALGLAVIDMIYVGRGRIAPIYLADLAIECALVAGWLFVLAKSRSAAP